MPGIFSRFFRLFKKKQARLLFIGLDNSGKSTIVHYLQNLPKKEDIVPTIGFSIEDFFRNNIHFNVIDMSGQGRYRSLWEHYYSHTDAIVFVIDSFDRERISVVKEELDLLLSHKLVKKNNHPILFLSNKNDLGGSLSVNSIVNFLDLDSIEKKSWHIMSTSALNGDGLGEAFEWVISQVMNNTKS